MITDEATQAIKERLVSTFHPDKIIIFGSQARGTADDRLHRWHKSFRNAVKRHHLLLGPLYAASRMVRVATR